VTTLDSCNTPRSARDLRNASPEEATGFNNEEKVAYYHQKAVNHPKLATVLESLDRHIFPSGGPQLVLLVGPPGVGKSRAIEVFENRVIKRFLPEMTADPGLLPIVVMDAGSSGDKAFSWKNFYTSLQRRLGGQVQSTISGLRDGVESSLHWRSTKVLVIDEGKHLFGSMSQRSLEGHMDSLKSLASMAGITIVLAGSYDLLKVLEMSGQIARRVKLIHFQRYDRTEPSEELAFQLALRRLALNLPAKGVPNFDSYSAKMHDCTNGCVGALKDLFMAALKASFWNESIWRMDHLISSLPTAAQLDAMIRETDQGEQFLQRTEFESGAYKRVEGLKQSLADFGKGSE